MIIRKHANKTYSEFNKIITSKAKTVGNYGINWICNNKHRIILYYESGETDSRGLLQLLKSYFWGYYRVKNGVTTITGIIISGPIVLGFMAFVLLLESIFLDPYEFFSCFIFYLPILLWLYFGEKRNRKNISDYIDVLLK